ncbi:MAG: MFS transporter [Marmoricola sp.]
MRTAGLVTGRGARFAFLQARRAARAEGADASGLARLIELSAVAAAGDAAVTISLAGTLFFANPGGSREPVALYLGMTMLPFALLAPLLGPFLDRFSHGRRWAIGGTLALRGFLCWLMADAIASHSIAIYPYALGVLVCSKAYGVARSATVPRLVPDNLTLVKANGRISLAGIVGVAVSAPLAGLASLAGAQWSMRYAFVVFMAATILAVLLPARSDSTDGEESVSLSGRAPQKFRLPSSVVFALRCNAGLKVLSGFLFMFLAFLLKQHPLPGWEHRDTLLLGLVIGAVGVGNTVGIAAGSLLRRVQPRITVIVALLADTAAAIFAALFFGLVPAMVLGLVSGLGAAIGKLALDSTIQNDVPERVRTSAFARSETLLQLTWVVGGFIGIALPLNAGLGMWTLSAIMVGWIAYVLVRPRMLAQQTGPATAGDPFAGRTPRPRSPGPAGRPLD